MESAPERQAAQVGPFVPLRRVEEVTGITQHALHHKHRPLRWGVPGHWRIVRGVTVYAVRVLPELAAALATDGETDAAMRLRMWLNGLTAGGGGRGVAPAEIPAAPARKSWVYSWEERQS
ncbi:MAG TPA: hypothetical protein VHF69_00075 [Candidatus Synoicihabitans sp.]|nr:hypothetical protein [Candidatus Synoicihabitans sp.]